MVNKLLNNLRSLRCENGLYIASPGEWYQKVWVRDSFYESLPELETNPNFYKQTYQSLLDYYIKIQRKYKKFYHLIVNPDNKEWFEFPHPRFTPGLEEINERWGTKQWDCFGEFLYGLYLGESAGIHIIRGDEDRYIIKLIIEFLEAIKYWERPDSGIWEEGEETRSSSVGAVVAGLTAIKQLDFYVPQELIDKGHKTLNRLLPYETATRDCDLALLTLIYPFNIVPTDIGRQIIKNVEEKLLRELGVIRYVGDWYFNTADSMYRPWFDPEATRIGGEMRWAFGESFLKKCHDTYGNHKESAYYKERVLKTIDENGNIAEGYNAKTGKPNYNNPLGWSLAMAIMALK